jgi:uncharacterized integral membrane protein
MHVQWSALFVLILLSLLIFYVTFNHDQRPIEFGCLKVEEERREKDQWGGRLFFLWD